jgi:hypothetical protein
LLQPPAQAFELLGIDGGTQRFLHPVMAGQELTLEIHDLVLELAGGRFVQLIPGVDPGEFPLAFGQPGLGARRFSLGALDDGANALKLLFGQRRGGWWVLGQQPDRS